jgi:hypothetical protein
MNRLAFCLSVLVLSLPAYGRIGETIEECETRYGAPIEKVAPGIPESDPQALVYSKAGITIIVEFKGGKAWKQLYQLIGMDDASVTSMLKAEIGDGKWSQGLKLGNNIVRTSEDRSRLSIVMPARRARDPGIMVVATKSHGRANFTDYKTKLVDALQEIQRRKSGKPIDDL